jgi:fumarate hydratase class II
MSDQSLGRDLRAAIERQRRDPGEQVDPRRLESGLAALVTPDQQSLLPALKDLIDTTARKAGDVGDIVKTGRTHLMDAMPLTLGQELFAWASQIGHAEERLKETERRLHALPLGGTAIGTGVNAHPRFAERACADLARFSGAAPRR